MRRAGEASYRGCIRRGAVTAAALVLIAACSPGAGPAPSPSTAVSSVPASITSAPPVSATRVAERIERTETVTIVATGDVLLHPPLWDQARRDAERPRGGAENADADEAEHEAAFGTMDFRPMLAGVRPYVSSADLALCHLETPLAEPGGPFRGYPLFSGPPQIAPALAATGYDVCTTASNHTFDQGAAGVDRTLDTLDAAGIAHTGSARSPTEDRRVLIRRVHGVPVAVLAYSYGFNGRPYPQGDRWRADVIDADRILRDARRARERGAAIVVLALHWGDEYRHEPSAQQRALAPRLAMSGAVDLIVSHHAHVVEPIRRIGRTWVVYGLGNLLAAHATPGEANAEGLLTRFTFTRTTTAGTAGGRFTAGRAEYVPLLMTTSSPRRVLDVRTALARGRYGSSSRARLRSALTRTTRIVTSMDAVSSGLHTVSPMSR